MRTNALRPVLTLAAAILLTALGTRSFLAQHPTSTLHNDPTHPAAAHNWVDTRLYFGLGPADAPGKGVSDAAWRDFLDKEVTPRFPAGLSVLDVYGQWQGKEETTPERIRSKLLIIDYQATPDNAARIEAIRTAWKQRTGDQSVLKVTQPADVSFSQLSNNLRKGMRYDFSMRIRPTAFLLTVLWMGIAVLQIFTATLRYRRHFALHHVTELGKFDIIMVGFWGLLFLFYLHQLLFSRIEFDADALRIHNGMSRTSVQYNSIIAIRRAWLSNGKPIPNAVELEIARVDPGIFPHQYLILRSANGTALANAVHQRVPLATYDVA